MSAYNYTDAHFAATLIECGPHAWHDCAISQEECPMNRRYKDRCYKYFFTLFPEMVEHSHSDTAHGPSHEWTAFWAEYIVWVGDTGDRYHGED